jgi:hypothetical protein
VYESLKLRRQNDIFHLKRMLSANFLVTSEMIRTEPRMGEWPNICSEGFIDYDLENVTIRSSFYLSLSGHYLIIRSLEYLISSESTLARVRLPF